MKAVKQIRIYPAILIALIIYLFACGGSYKRSEIGGAPGSNIRTEGASGITDSDMSGLADKGKRYRKYDKKSKSVGKGGKSESQNRMIIYYANYTLMVDNVERTVRLIEGLAEKYRGFIESSASSDSYRYARVILRVPVKSFDSALADVGRLGRVNRKSVSATDVTMEYSDTLLRVRSAKKVRERMYQLLKRTKKVSERIKILREIERLSTLIDSLESRLSYLKNRASYSTIEIILKAVVKQVVSRYIPSPFPWIAGLNVDRRSIYSKGELEFDKPAGFYYQDKEFYGNKQNIFLFSTPGEKAEIRAGTVKNYPPADGKFWKEAFNIDVGNRRYKLIGKSDVNGKLGFTQYILKPYKNIIYLIAFSVSREKIAVVEARFSSDQDYQKYRKKTEDFIKSVRFR